MRNGSVLDLQIDKGEITAKVSGSDLYTIRITIAPVPTERWTSLARDCAGSIDSVVELLQGRIAKGVMDRVCRQGDGLFPSPNEIKLSCSCPDWADMCKHVAAALYGVGARLDRQPELLFALRGVDAQDMIAKAGEHLATPALGASSDKVLADADMAALFGLDMADEAVPAAVAPASAALTKRGQRERATKRALPKAIASQREKVGPEPANVAARAKRLDQGRSSAKSLSASRGADAQSTTASASAPPPTRQTKAKTKPPAPKAPTKSQERLEALIEEATIDAHGEGQQAVGLYTMICEHLILPFKTKILGRDADVVDIEMDDDDRLLAVCKIGRRRQRIDLVNIDLPAKRPAGAAWIVAYRMWSRRNGSG
jgi:uncharacterized Zn finger protein